MRGDGFDEVLKRLPHTWTAGEAEQVKQRFRESHGRAQAAGEQGVAVLAPAVPG